MHIFLKLLGSNVGGEKNTEKKMATQRYPPLKSFRLLPTFPFTSGSFSFTSGSFPFTSGLPHGHKAMLLGCKQLFAHDLETSQVVHLLAYIQA